MTAPPIPTETVDVPSQVFRAFVESLEKAEVPAEFIARLRLTLLEKPDFSETALKSAVLGDETST